MGWVETFGSIVSWLSYESIIIAEPDGEANLLFGWRGNALLLKCGVNTYSDRL